MYVALNLFNEWTDLDAVFLVTYYLTALDPALPLFATNDNNKKIDPSDALYVDVVHTNALEKGKLETCGHIDFYPNGGMTQPGCKTTANQSNFLQNLH